MRKTYSYNEAVKILGGSQHPIVAKMDKLLNFGLLAGSLGMWQVLDLFDAKPDFIKLSNDLISRVSEKRRGVSRHTRTQQLHAAHAILVMTAFFEAFEEQRVSVQLTAQDRDLVALLTRGTSACRCRRPVGRTRTTWPSSGVSTTGWASFCSTSWRVWRPGTA